MLSVLDQKVVRSARDVRELIHYIPLRVSDVFNVVDVEPKKCDFVDLKKFIPVRRIDTKKRSILDQKWCDHGPHLVSDMRELIRHVFKVVHLMDECHEIAHVNPIDSIGM